MKKNFASSYRIFDENNVEEIRKLCGTAHSADIAKKLSELPISEIHDVISKINPHKAAQIFNYFSDSLQLKIAKISSDGEIASIIDFLESDEQADIIKRFDKNRQKRVLSLLPEQDSTHASALAAYPEGTSGAVMTKSFITVPFSENAESAKNSIADFDDINNLHYIYLTDKAWRVCGSVRVVNLVNVDNSVQLSEIADSEVISVRALEDQEMAARKIQRYDLLSIPVVDEIGRVLGIITYDDAFDVLIKEQTEDMQKIMAISSSDSDNGESYLNISAWQHFKKRITWIVGLAVLGLVSGYVLHTFENVLSSLVILAIYMPMLADTGGNTGSQSATLVIRALALGELRSKDVLKVLFKELKISMMVSVILMFLAYWKIALLSGGSAIPIDFSLPQIGIAISVALGIQVISSTLIGAVLPIIVSSMKLDPAVIAAPAITSVVDITGLLIYFYVIGVMLGV